MSRRRPTQAPECWHATAAEVASRYPCDELATARWVPLTRAVDVAAPTATVFRWLCQLRVAPYSYDWIDNLGRRSPRQLTPGLEQLELGQWFLIGALHGFVPDEQMTIAASRKAERLFGVIALTFQVRAAGPERSRLIARLVVREPVRIWEKGRYEILAWGDLIMTRKELLTLKKLAERQVKTPWVDADRRVPRVPGSHPR